MASAAAPGSFAAVLRQSKFATYHPSIGQVYTVFGGHAQRGDWGLKRPLPERKRHRRLKISALDTREQQSWFDSGESDARTVARWDEIGTRVLIDYQSGRWQEQGFTRLAARAQPTMDSEFASFAPSSHRGTAATSVDPALGIRYEFDSRLFPNIHKMSDAGFTKYLKKIESRRREFRQHVQLVEDLRHRQSARPSTPTPTAAEGEDQDPDQDTPPVALYRYRNKSGESFTRTGNDFLELVAEDEVIKADSRILQSVPHPNGGLSYAAPSYLQTRLTTPPIQSHAIFAYGAMAVVGGVTARVAPDWVGNGGINNMGGNRDVLQVDWRRVDTQRGTYAMRVIDAHMQDPPHVVGRGGAAHRGVRRLKMSVDVHPVGLDAMDHARANPYPPGSIPYCFSESGRSAGTPTRPPMKRVRPMMTDAMKKRQMVDVSESLDNLLGPR